MAKKTTKQTKLTQPQTLASADSVPAPTKYKPIPRFNGGCANCD